MSLRADHIRLHYHHYHSLPIFKADSWGQKCHTIPTHTQTHPQRLDSHHKIWKSKVKLFLSIRADQVQWHSPFARMVHLDKNPHHFTCNHPTPRFRSKDPTHITIGEKLMWQKFCPLGQTIFTEIYWNMFVPGSLLIHNPTIQTHPQRLDSHHKVRKSKVKLFWSIF